MQVITVDGGFDGERKEYGSNDREGSNSDSLGVIGYRQPTRRCHFSSRIYRASSCHADKTRHWDFRVEYCTDSACSIGVKARKFQSAARGPT
jgi:hypothetical protein